jgi:hypothetical protein
MLSVKIPRSRVRLYAAAWTAAVAAIPAYIAAGTGGIADVFIVPGRIPLTLVAILAASISGYWIGWRLIDPTGDHDSPGALFLGAAICLLSYYLLGVLVAVPETVQTMAAHNTFTPLALLIAPLAASPWILVGAPYFALVYGIPPTWYTFPVACIAGFVLSFCYRRR